MYDKVRDLNSDIILNNNVVERITGGFSGNLVFPQILASLNKQQTDNYRDNGISRDSLTSLYTTINNIYSSDAVFLNSVTKGDLNVLNTVATSDADPSANIQVTKTALNKLLNYINNFYANPINASALNGTLAQLKMDFRNWIEAMNTNLKKYALIKTAKQNVLETLKKASAISAVNLNFTSSFSQDIVTRGKLSIAPDFGVACYGFLQGKSNDHFTSVMPYLGVQLNWRPYDQSVSLKSLPSTRKGPFNLIRFSSMIGVTLISVKEAGKRDNFFGNSNLLLGFGYRLTTEVRLVAGTMLFKKYDINYVSNRTNLAATAYAGVSIDLNLKDLFSNIFGPFSGK